MVLQHHLHHHQGPSHHLQQAHHHLPLNLPIHHRDCQDDCHQQAPRHNRVRNSRYLVDFRMHGHYNQVCPYYELQVQGCVQANASWIWTVSMAKGLELLFDSEVLF